MSRLRRLEAAYRRARDEMRGVRVVVERRSRRGRPTAPEPHELAYGVGLCKEEVAREHVFGQPGEDLAFLDVGARDGRLDYLLGVRRDLQYDPALHAENLRRFRAKYRYHGLDLEPEAAPHVLRADLCTAADPVFDAHREVFDVVYSNNVFEHLRRPWVAAGHLDAMLKPGGIAITIAPFAIRFHAVPDDYFRYTHRALTALFAEHGPVEELVSGYDIAARRVDWQGGGAHSDLVPEDRLGAWRENWFVVNVVRKR